MVTRCYKNSCNMMGFATLNCLSAAKEGAYRTVRNTELPLSCQAGCIVKGAQTGHERLGLRSRLYNRCATEI
eukprot:scaffold117198_cov20-Tisochrysis_lutea.AAC.2